MDGTGSDWCHLPPPVWHYAGGGDEQQSLMLGWILSSDWRDSCGTSKRWRLRRWRRGGGWRCHTGVTCELTDTREFLTVSGWLAEGEPDGLWQERGACTWDQKVKLLGNSGPKTLTWTSVMWFPLCFVTGLKQEMEHHVHYMGHMTFEENGTLNHVINVRYVSHSVKAGDITLNVFLIQITPNLYFQNTSVE